MNSYFAIVFVIPVKGIKSLTSMASRTHFCSTALFKKYGKRTNLSAQALFDVFEEIFSRFKSNAESYRSVGYRHLGTLLGSEESEDGGCRMNGKRLAVEEVCGATDDLQFVNESEGSLF